MWLKASSFYNRIMLFSRLSLIFGEHLTTAQYMCSSQFPSIHFRLLTAEPVMHAQPLSNAYKNWITQLLPKCV
jgi:hypothetical protein